MCLFGSDKLKSVIFTKNSEIDCPVRDCTQKVPRQREFFKRLENFKCPKHKIYISPSTFEYEYEQDNLLWKDEADLVLFNRIKKVKRENRMAHDNSEDALTWNVFRFLEKHQLLANFLEDLVKRTLENAEIIYWSYSQLQKDVWSSLKTAREEFETVPKKGS